MVLVRSFSIFLIFFSRFIRYYTHFFKYIYNQSSKSNNRDDARVGQGEEGKRTERMKKDGMKSKFKVFKTKKVG
jgi:hypothetical protein